MAATHTQNLTHHIAFPTVERTEALLLHPHAWVRLSSARLTGLLFAAYKPEELASGASQGGEYLLESTTEKVHVHFTAQGRSMGMAR